MVVPNEINSDHNIIDLDTNNDRRQVKFKKLSYNMIFGMEILWK
jgi:hypothetical protein